MLFLGSSCSLLKRQGKESSQFARLLRRAPPRPHPVVSLEMETDFATTRGSALLSAGDSSKAASDRFLTNVKDLFEFITSLNTYVGESAGAPPIPGPFMTLVSVGISAIREPTVSEIINQLLIRTASAPEMILSRDVSAISASASLLFPEVPDMVVQGISAVVESGHIPDESISDIFDTIDSLIRISISKHCLDVVTAPGSVSRPVADTVLKSLYDSFQKPTPPTVDSNSV